MVIIFFLLCRCFPFIFWSLVCCGASSCFPLAPSPALPFSLVVGSRHLGMLTWCLFSGKERDPPLNISICKNGQYFPDRFSGKRTISQLHKFEKIYLIYPSFWRVIKHEYLKNMMGPPICDHRDMFLQQLSPSGKQILDNTDTERFS